MSAQDVSSKKIILVFLTLVLALFLRAIVQSWLVRQGFDRPFAANVAYLVVPAVLCIALIPLWNVEKGFIAGQFATVDAYKKIIIKGIVAGILIRGLYWAQLIGGVSFGWIQSANPGTSAQPELVFSCGSWPAIALAFVVSAALTPLIEEVIHRAYAMHFLAKFGGAAAIVISALLFAVFHNTVSWWFPLVAGFFFGYAYWHTGSLWFSFSAHATVNSLVILDWRCLKARWNPSDNDLPLILPGSIAVIVFMLCCIGLILILRSVCREANRPPRDKPQRL